jgi:hypothetical protein
MLPPLVQTQHPVQTKPGSLNVTQHPPSGAIALRKASIVPPGQLPDDDGIMHPCADDDKGGREAFSIGVKSTKTVLSLKVWCGMTEVGKILQTSFLGKQFSDV